MCSFVAAAAVELLAVIGANAVSLLMNHNCIL